MSEQTKLNENSSKNTDLKKSYDFKSPTYEGYNVGNNPFLNLHQINTNPFINPNNNSSNQNPFISGGIENSINPFISKSNSKSNPFLNSEDSGSEMVKNNTEDAMIQADWAVEPPNPEAVAPELSEEDMQEAITFNQRTLRDPNEIRELRDVLGVDGEADSVVIDANFVRALADFQAQQDINPDGKMGAITSSRLSRELHAEARDLGRRTPEGRPLEAYARRMDMRTMSIQVTQQATLLPTSASVPNNLARFRYDVVFRIPDTTANGWIIQHHLRRVNVTDAAGSSVTARNPTNEYWEAWQVVNGVVMAGPASQGRAPRDLNDQYQTTFENQNTKGTISLLGKVTFLPNYNFNPSDWSITAVGVHPAGILPHRNTAPPGWNESAVYQHNMNITFDGTVTPNVNRANTQP